MRPSLELFRSHADLFEQEVYLDGRLNIVGWRNAEQDGSFCDWISVYKFLNDTWLTFQWPATTVPGLSWLRRPMVRKGTAVLVPGQYRYAYALGRHKGVPALVQIEPVRVYRDGDLDDVFDLDPDTIEQGNFGINIHRASAMAKVIGSWSAGCQVFKSNADFEEFLALCEFSGQSRFTYTLIGFDYDL